MDENKPRIQPETPNVQPASSKIEPTDGEKDFASSNSPDSGQMENGSVIGAKSNSNRKTVSGKQVEKKKEQAQVNPINRSSYQDKNDEANKDTLDTATFLENIAVKKDKKKDGKFTAKQTEEMKNAKTKDIDFYAMPKEFQKHNPVAGKSRLKGFSIMAGSLLLLLLIGGAVYVYVLNPQAMESLMATITGKQPQSTPTQSQTVPEQPQQPENQPVIGQEEDDEEEPVATEPDRSPEDVYLSYVEALHEVDSFDGYYQLINEYGTKRKIEQVEADKLIYDSSPDAGKEVVDSIKEQTPLLVGEEDIEADISSDRALLDIVLADGDSNGSIEMRLVDNKWKVHNENWQLAQIEEEENIYSPGVDRDSDGLTDEEEKLLATNKDSSDSDGDGYSDQVEVLNLYDPAGSAKLIDSPYIKSYIDGDKRFSLIHPSEWFMTTSNNSVSFNNTNNHFFQVTMYNNSNNESLDDYFMRMMNLDVIDSAMRKENDSWRGIATKDGLYVYLTGLDDNAVIFVLQYGPAESNVLEYQTLFQAFVNSFVIK